MGYHGTNTYFYPNEVRASREDTSACDRTRFARYDIISVSYEMRINQQKYIPKKSRINDHL